jgi:hypothetical protein
MKHTNGIEICAETAVLQFGDVKRLSALYAIKVT